MHILIVTDYYPPDKIGGVGEIAARLRDEYVALGHRVTVITTGVARAEERAAGILRGAARLSVGVFLNNWLVWRTLRRDPAEVVHLHQSSTTLWLLVRRLLPRAPRVLSSLQVSYRSEAREIRSVDLDGRRFRPRRWERIERFVFAPVHRLLDGIGYLASDAVTVVSQQNRDELYRGIGRWAPREVYVVPNGAPQEIAPREPLPDELQARLAGRVVIGSVGVFRMRKRLPALLLAFQRIHARHPQATVLVVGGGRGYEREYRELAESLGISAQVLFAGAVPAASVGAYLRRMDVFALLSSYEGMPIALLEAMRAGAAIVTTGVFGMKDALEQDDPEALVPVDDIAAAARRLDALLADPGLRSRAARAAERAAARNEWRGVAQQYLAIMDAQ